MNNRSVTPDCLPVHRKKACTWVICSRLLTEQLNTF
jgi:hypothetical protein